MKKIVVIGGGAAGLVCAIYAKTKDNEVIILERNSTCGKKILQTGNGHCNYWNSNQELSHYHTTNPEMISDIINKKNQEEILLFFSKLGIIPKIKNGYYYPYSNQATSIRNTLLIEAKNKQIIIKENVLVEEVIKKDSKFIIKSNNEIIEADSAIIATGGKSFPKTGSDGTGYNIAKSFNHSIIKPLPSLVQLKTQGNFLKDWDGVRSDVKIYLKEDNKIIRSTEGEIQLTNYGVSGICIFNLSGRINRGLDLNKKEELIINFLPIIDTDPKTFMEKRSNFINSRTISEQLESILNYKLVNVILKLSKINPNLNYNDLSEKEKTTLIKNLTNFNLQVTSSNSFDKAQVTTGGIPLTEINPRTMESLKCKNLYFAGEILDVDGDCGGYNLGFAWVSGMLSGKSNRGE